MPVLAVWGEFRDILHPPHPFSALFTAPTISSMVMSPLASASPAAQSESGAVPSVMFTRVMVSFTVTSPLPSQSPRHGVGVGDGVDVTVPVAVTVVLGLGVAVVVGLTVAEAV